LLFPIKIKRSEEFILLSVYFLLFIAGNISNTYIPLLNETQKIERENVSDTFKVSDTYNKFRVFRGKNWVYYFLPRPYN
jgi:hypothetical protein